MTRNGKKKKRWDALEKSIGWDNLTLEKCKRFVSEDTQTANIRHYSELFTSIRVSSVSIM